MAGTSPAMTETMDVHIPAFARMALSRYIPTYISLVASFNTFCMVPACIFAMSS